MFRKDLEIRCTAKAPIHAVFRWPFVSVLATHSLAFGPVSFIAISVLSIETNLQVHEDAFHD